MSGPQTRSSATTSRAFRVVIDTSAIVAILQDEPERREFNEVIEAATERRISAASFVEASIVVDARYGNDGLRAFDLFFAKAGIETCPVDAEQAQIARQAYRDYGRKRHAAALNFGDCFAYALAVQLGEPLLYKGSDFSMTDVTGAR